MPPAPGMSRTDLKTHFEAAGMGEQISMASEDSTRRGSDAAHAPHVFLEGVAWHAAVHQHAGFAWSSSAPQTRAVAEYDSLSRCSYVSFTGWHMHGVARRNAFGHMIITMERQPLPAALRHACVWRSAHAIILECSCCSCCCCWHSQDWPLRCACAPSPHMQIPQHTQHQGLHYGCRICVGKQCPYRSCCTDANTHSRSHASTLACSLVCGRDEGQRDRAVKGLWKRGV